MGLLVYIGTARGSHIVLSGHSPSILGYETKQSNLLTSSQIVLASTIFDL